MKNQYDVIVIGGGPAGYTAALYTARAGLRTLVIEKMYPGGQMVETTQIDNYPGNPEGIDGATLGASMHSNAKRFGAETVIDEVRAVRLKEKTVHTVKACYTASAIIIATGADHRRLGLEKEQQLVGKGVAYCASCDGALYRGKTVAVVGGGNSAAADALLLSRIAKKVHLIHRRDTLRADRVNQAALEQAENVEFHWNTAVDDLLHGEVLSGARLRNLRTGAFSELPLDGLFISIGRSPSTQLFTGQLELDSDGYIIADESTRTSLPGVFAAGDVRTKQVRQIVTAEADGAVAAHYAREYLDTLEHSSSALI